MAFDNHYPNRKDWRRGSCPWCEQNRRGPRARTSHELREDAD